MGDVKEAVSLEEVFDFVKVTVLEDQDGVVSKGVYELVLEL
jgi:hypothetical protein